MEGFWANRFEHFRELYRRDDGSKWTGAALERATGGAVSSRYISALRGGQIKDPSYTRIYAISKAMGIPIGAWLEEDKGEDPRLGD